ncbi:2Fe-2S iron-sulfur cluster-binding protein [Candidatus Aminicenantes bacterium AC-708-M15]|jgi:NADH-quinone oxidoreductase subunit G|nr:2Fe-2S iron-sulfur cluster-binding protein [SCandidatus Aminicenantes bacterium Aminicenantia_JdfR_composite]MCP2596751.1 2Fe-2S iron-sulfur cluster-binding protein [Candidatus Aminicenantes bacterium AC-335-G13]MCP2604409.1 2Fe-2S iron-sulfur cluster-binding protein [Candidatus Aminicenantes bacterium AC-708-M15]MCP2619255.1 2Fe-2S iron-sulfur cluster-binding protein [Candidatus Aminicenantes bacterium AC-335-K20]MCP2620443.1 2Fe-2S iron-sulfur cluster-binding protein [Candidatus Aminicenan
MIKITINGKNYKVKEGLTILEASKQVGIEIPHFCYHPALESEGSCRMCLVEIKGVPKLQLACSTPIKDGMEIETENERVIEARKAVLEFLLAGHPLDCPICDKAGECKLQDYYYKFGLFEDRFEEEKPKRDKLFRIAPNLIYDQERCILCTRCVRFLREITKTGELGVLNRGKESLISIYEQELIENNYSGNLADICPVGAITDIDFRFKIRTWFLERKKSICPICSRGCNINIHFLSPSFPFKVEKRVFRITPEPNVKINGYWICNLGRYNYHYIDNDRILHPLKRNGELKQISWEEFYEDIGNKIKILIRRKKEEKIGVIVNLSLTNEEYETLEIFFNKCIPGTEIITFGKKSGKEDNFLLTEDRNANRKGAGKYRFKEKKIDILKFLNKKELVIFFGHEITEHCNIQLLSEALKDIKTKVLIASNKGPLINLVDYILPSTVIAEKEGSFTNSQGITQKFYRVLEPLGESRPEIEILTSLAQKSGIWRNFLMTRRAG